MAPPPALTSRTNPRVKAAVGLRDRRERERHGLTLVDGAREVRRAHRRRRRRRRGVRLRAAARRTGRPRGPRRAPRAGIAPDARSTRPSSRKLAFGDRAEGLLARRPASRTCASSASRCRPTRWSSSSRASRSPATSARSCAPPTAPGRTPSSRPRRGRTSSTPTRSGPAPGTIFACRSRRRRRRTCWPGPRTRAAHRRRAGGCRAVRTPTPTCAARWPSSSGRRRTA